MSIVTFMIDYICDLVIYAIASLPGVAAGGEPCFEPKNVSCAKMLHLLILEARKCETKL